jgi:transcriptional regulator with XRE-family HTH domain
MGNYGMEIQQAIAVQIKAEMAAKDWKQADMVKATGIVGSTLSRYLNAGRDIPLPAFLEIAKALGLSIGELTARAQRRLDASRSQDVL